MIEKCTGCGGAFNSESGRKLTLYSPNLDWQTGQVHALNARNRNELGDNMDLSHWLTAVATAVVNNGLFAGALWWCKEMIATRLTKSVQHEYDKKIESLRSDFSTALEKLKAQLRERENEISALRSGTLSAIAARHEATSKRRLEAVDQLWSTIIALSPARTIAITVSTFNYKGASRVSTENPKFRTLVSSIEKSGIGKDFDPEAFNHPGAEIARPYVSSMVWAVFIAIRSITVFGWMRQQMLAIGTAEDVPLDSQLFWRVVDAVLPGRFAEEHFSSTMFLKSVYDALDEKLLDEIREMLAGKQDDLASLEQSNEIIGKANFLLAPNNNNHKNP